MSWLNDRNSFLLAVIFYGVSMLHSVFLWRKGFRHHDWINYGLLAVGFLFQTCSMVLRGITWQHCPINNVYEAMGFITWTIVGVCLISGLLPRFRFLGAFAAPLVFAVGIFALAPALDPLKAQAESNWMRSLHAALALLSYGAFGLGAISASMFLTQQHDLKLHKPRAFFALLPSMERLEKVMSRLLFVGASLLTISLALVPFLIEQQKSMGHGAKDPVKFIWSIVVWVTYFLLLFRHSRFGLTGRRFAWGAIGVFVFVLLTFWGINALSPFHQI